MRLYLLRHGPAGAGEGWSGPDEERPLTDDGREVVASLADRLAALGVSIDLILTSPYARAAQTAGIVAERLGASAAMEEDPRLASGFGMDDMRAILAEHADVDALMLVGHEPDFSEVTSALIGGGVIKFKKAGLARVDIGDPAAARGVLVWLAQPALMKS